MFSVEVGRWKLIEGVNKVHIAKKKLDLPALSGRTADEKFNWVCFFFLNGDDTPMNGLRTWILLGKKNEAV